MSPLHPPLEGMFKIEGLTTICDEAIFQWFEEELDLDDSLCLDARSCMNIATVVEMEYDLPITYTDHDTFIGHLTECLISRDKVFIIKVSLPLFSNESNTEILTREVFTRYGELSFLDNHLQINHLSNPNRIELVYPLFDRYYKELIEKYPEEVI